MTLDTRARRAADLARMTAAEIDPAEPLGRVKSQSRQRRAGGAVAAAAAILVLGAAAYGLQATGDSGAPHRPLIAGSPTVSAPVPHTNIGCDPEVTCFGHGLYRVALRYPLWFQLPAGWSRGVNTFGGQPDMAEVYAGDRRGVTILEDPTPVMNTSAWQPDTSTARDARSLAQWIAARPFLVGARVTRVRIGLNDVWRVTAAYDPHAPYTATRDGQAIAPVMKMSVGSAGWLPGMTATYTLFDQPGGGTVAFWAWSLDPRHPTPPDPDPIIASLIH